MADNMPPLLSFYLIFMEAALTLPFVLFNGGNIYIQGGMVIAVSSALHILYSIVKDFDNPITGFYNVSSQGLRDFVQRENDKELEHLFFHQFRL